MFVSIDCEPWFPPPDDATLAEVRYGILPNGYRSQLQDQAIGMPPAWQFRQEASHGLVLPHPLFGAPIRLFGMHPERSVIECTVPEAPPTVHLIMEHNGTASGATPPRSPRAWSAHDDVRGEPLTPRPFIPGSAAASRSVSVNGDTPCCTSA
jgi:hypothetical protein